MYFMSTVCGRPQGGRGSGPCGQGEGGDQKRDFFVDVINGWPPISIFSTDEFFRFSVMPLFKFRTDYDV